MAWNIPKFSGVGNNRSSTLLEVPSLLNNVQIRTEEIYCIFKVYVTEKWWTYFFALW